jgi:hypothetical protein
MKTRTVVHIALNAKNQRVGNLVEAAGRLIPFEGWCFTHRSEMWGCRAASEWIDDDYNTESTLKKWKKDAAKFYKAVRFQRVTLIGESK